MSRGLRPVVRRLGSETRPEENQMTARALTKSGRLRSD